MLCSGALVGVMPHDLQHMGGGILDKKLSGIALLDKSGNGGQHGALPCHHQTEPGLGDVRRRAGVPGHFHIGEVAACVSAVLNHIGPVSGIDLDTSLGEALFQRLAQAKAALAHAKIQHIGLLFKIINHRAVVQDGRGIDAQFREEMLHARLATAGGDGKAPAVFHEPFRCRAVFR